MEMLDKLSTISSDAAKLSATVEFSFGAEDHATSLHLVTLQPLKVPKLGNEKEKRKAEGCVSVLTFLVKGSSSRKLHDLA
ncbi:Uncharacterized protein TCM_021165 [Theobroma cacao]|uniref:Uncharacterized protein n=1 Tax=Theobroma cacao TaxID=3641 RepID=A0A061EP63_THECC|nr:Uncharacterized protein TCM_021165 [Theobroma cacao]